MSADGYSQVGDAIVTRIDALVPAHPEILTMQDPWGLLKVAGFKVDDLQPTMFQVSWALRRVQARHAQGKEVKP